MTCRGSCGRALTGKMRPVCNACHEAKVVYRRPVRPRTEDEYAVALRRYLQRAKCIEPFTPEVAEFVDRLAGEFLGGEL